MRIENKIAIFFCFTLLLTFRLNSQAPSNIHVSGKHILGPCGDTLILKGVNYAPYNWGWTSTQLRLGQIALSGANCVRMPWYVTTPDGPTPQAVYNNLVLLDSALSKCIKYKMIPIIELHDQTCQNNPANLITTSNWFVQPAVKTLINKYKHSIILNIANEALWVAWAGNTLTAQSSFSNTYNTIVNTIRSNSITVPIMIDGPECGTNLDVLANIGGAMLNADPLQNLIFSAHAYWNTYANNDSLQALNKINYALSKNIPFVFGEVANLQDGNNMCQYTLNYKPWIKILKQKKIGWLAWSWDNDGCAARQITTNGNYNSLTVFGNDIINNSIYGLNVGTIKSLYLMNNKTCPAPPPPPPTGINEYSLSNAFKIIPNPTTGDFIIRTDIVVDKITVYDIAGAEVSVSEGNYKTFHLNNILPGIYFISLNDVQGKRYVEKLIVQ